MHLVRINPASKRQTHVHRGRAFKKSKNWYGPFDDPKLAAQLKKVRENNANPERSICVFEVKTEEEVRNEALNIRRAAPAGTAEAPNPIPGEMRKLKGALEQAQTESAARAQELTAATSELLESRRSIERLSAANEAAKAASEAATAAGERIDQLEARSAKANETAAKANEAAAKRIADLEAQLAAATAPPVDAPPPASAPKKKASAKK